MGLVLGFSLLGCILPAQRSGWAPGHGATQELSKSLQDYLPSSILCSCPRHSYHNGSMTWSAATKLSSLPMTIQAIAPDTFRLRLLNGCNARVLQLRFAQ